MNPPRMSPTAFCRMAMRVFPDLPLNDVADLVKPECLPDWEEVTDKAIEMADRMNPATADLNRFIRLREIHEWAADQCGKAVAA